ncbi:hypothetical protein LDENG_00206300 [Lucifuga dentata]|nr:hypothetical protein LDENG_00206300 [Lucifuga dentata]
MKFDSILEELDGLGPFQISIIVLLSTSRMVLPCHFLLNNFIAATPPHRCNVSTLLDDAGLLRNVTQEQKLAARLPAGEDGSWKSCEMFAEPQFHFLSNDSSGSHGSHPPTVPCQSGWIYDNSTVTSTLVSEWDLVCGRRSLSKATSSIFFFGVMFAFGYISDKFGRKTSLLASYVMAIVFGFSSAFADSFSMFAALRFLTGFGLSGISITSIVLSIEWVNTRHRTFIGVVGSLFWSVGNMLLACLAWLVTDWRMLMVTVTAPLGFAVVSWWWISESARWLLANGKVERAQSYLDKCAQANKRPKLSSKVKLQMLSDVETEKQNKNYSYLHLVKTPKIRRLMLLTGILWFGVASTYYGISLNISGFGFNIYLTHFIYAAIEVPAKILIYFFLNMIGRRKCQTGTLLLTGICIAINIFLPKGLWHLRTLVAILGKGLSEASFTTAFLHTPELFPTVIRQNALGYTSFMSRLGVSVAPLILLLEDVWTLLPQIVICCVAVWAGLLALLLPETLNVRLPEVIDDVEHPRKNHISDAVELTDVMLASKITTDVQQQRV